MTPKKLGKDILCRLLERQVRQLRRRNDFKVVAVAGSVGKTSTKLAIAKTLSGSIRVMYQDGNYNDRLTVPLVVFGQVEPGIYDLFAWARILWDNQRQLRRPYLYDVAVLELGTDAPGQLRRFAYLRPDVSVITAVADEHMEYFKHLDEVAAEELEPTKFSASSLLNVDDIPAQYLPDRPHQSYGLYQAADYQVLKSKKLGLEGQYLTCKLSGGEEFEVAVRTLGEQGAKIVLAAAAVAQQLGLSTKDIQRNLQTLGPVAGRMQILPGKKESVLIDDTYNASPVAVRAALDVLQAAEASQRIAVLGSMNELGADSEMLHREIGAQCDPAKLDLVVTIGDEAALYLAPAAEQRGCRVKTFLNPLEAGTYVLEQLKPKAVVLVKGSQNGVFAEEALKPLLADSADVTKLVRQSAYWLKRKRPLLS